MNYCCAIWKCNFDRIAHLKIYLFNKHITFKILVLIKILSHKFLNQNVNGLFNLLAQITYSRIMSYLVNKEQTAVSFIELHSMFTKKKKG